MGTINYGTSEYITLGYNCNAEYTFDDFGTGEDEQRQFEISFLYDEVIEELDKFNFYFFNVAIKPGYYEGFYIDIENNFPVAFDCWQDKRYAQKEITQIKKFLLVCAKFGLVECFPGWCMAYSDYTDTIKAIGDAIKNMRYEVKCTPTYAQYEKASA